MRTRRFDRNSISLQETVGFAAALFLTGTAFLSISPLIPEIQLDLDVATRYMGLPSAAYSLSLGLSALTMAFVITPTSRVGLLWIGVLAHSMGLTLASWTLSFPILVLGFVLCGIGAGLIQPAIFALVSDHSVTSNRANAISKVNLGWALSTLIGVPAIAILSSATSWRLVLSAWAFMWIPVMLMLYTPLSVRRREQPIAMEADRVFVDASRAQWAELLVLHASTILVFAGYFGLYTFIGTSVQHSQAVGLPLVGLFIFLFGLGFLFGTMNGSIIDRFGVRKITGVIWPILAAILLLLSSGLLGTFLASLVMFAWGVLQSLTFIALTTKAGSYRKGIRGMALSLHSASIMIGATIGALISGFFYESNGFVGVGAVSCSATLLALVVFRMNTPGNWHPQ